MVFRPPVKVELCPSNWSKPGFIKVECDVKDYAILKNDPSFKVKDFFKEKPNDTTGEKTGE